MAQIELATLFSRHTAERIAQIGIEVARALGVPVDTWRAGDPTKAGYYYIGETLGSVEDAVVEFIRGGYLDYAEGDWLTVVADQVYNVQRPEATYATPGLVLANSSGFVYDFDAGDLTARASSTGKTYHSTSGGTLSSGGTLAVQFVADEPGADSSASPDEVDELVTQFLGVTISSSTQSLANDELDDESLRVLCRESTGPLSPAGPADAYAFVAKSSDLTGNGETTKTLVTDDSDTGFVTLYLAGASGPVSGQAIVAVDAAIAQWAAALCQTPTILNATALPVALDVTVYVRSVLGESEAAIQESVTSAIESLVASLPIGGNDGFLHRALLISKIQQTYPGYIYNVVITTPADDVAVAENEVVTISGTPTITVEFDDA